MVVDRDLIGAEIFVEVADQRVAGGRWYVLTSGVVRYQRVDGEFNPTAIVPAHTLRSSPSWRAAGTVEPPDQVQPH